MVDLKINPEKEVKRITKFIRTVVKRTKIKRVVIGLSGGIDSTTTLYLLLKALERKEIIIAHLYYFQPDRFLLSLLNQLNIPGQNINIISIKTLVNRVKTLLKITQPTMTNKIRLGNIMARIRMIILYDLAKNNNALVCGTENKSEYYLGYFTRYGDEASDFEPIRHLYKTQIYQLAGYLKIPKKIIQQPPTAGLWKKQTDEKELGFTYQQADPVLYLYFDKKINKLKIKKYRFNKAEEIINRGLRNQYKHRVPYSLSNPPI